MAGNIAYCRNIVAFGGGSGVHVVGKNTERLHCLEETVVPAI